MAKKQLKQEPYDVSIPADLDTIFLDTNVLDRSWPSLSNEIRRIARAANDLNISVHIPEVVRRELDHHWRTSLDALPTKLDQIRYEYARIVGDGWPSVKVPTSAEAHSTYLRAIEETLKGHNIVEHPDLPNVSCSELLDYAIQRDIAFEEEGKNFQDSLIVLSAVEHMIATSKVAGVIVSNDGVFERKRAVLELFYGSKNVRLLTAPPEKLLAWLESKVSTLGPQAFDSVTTTENVYLALIGADTMQIGDLRLKPMSWHRNVSEPRSSRVIQYRVIEGLPTGDEAFVAYFGKENQWRILHERHGQRGHWQGSYDSPQDAAAALQRRSHEDLVETNNLNQ